MRYKTCEQCGAWFPMTRFSGKKSYCGDKCYKDSRFIGQLSLRHKHNQNKSKVDHNNDVVVIRT